MKRFLTFYLFILFSFFSFPLFGAVDIAVGSSVSTPCNVINTVITFPGADATCNFDELPITITYPEELTPGFVFDEGQVTNVGAFTDTMLTVTKENQFDSYFAYRVQIYFVATQPGSHTITVSGTDSMGMFHETMSTLNYDFHVLNQSQVCTEKNNSVTINLGDLITPGTTAIQAPTIPGDTTTPNNPQNGTVGAVGSAPNYEVTYTPDANYCGADFFDYAVNDAGTFCELCQRVYLFVGKEVLLQNAQSCYKDFINILYNDPFEFAQCPFTQCAVHNLGNINLLPELYWLNFNAYADVSHVATPVSLNVTAGGATIDSFDPDTLIVTFSNAAQNFSTNTFELVDQNNCAAPFSFILDEPS